MGVNCRYSYWDSGELFEGHDSQFKIGVVKTAEIVGNEVVITGGLWSFDFAELCDKVKSAKDSLGWSIEPLMYLEDKGDYYEASETEFRGVALMWADKAAFADTYMFAQRKNNGKGGIPMEKQELQELLAVFATNIAKTNNDAIDALKLEFAEKVEAVSKGVTEGFAKIEAEKAAQALAAEEAQKKAEEDAKVAADLEAKTKAEALEAQRKTLQFGVQVKKFEGDTDAQKAVMADSNLSPAEQFRKLIDLKLEANK
jgi:hypothetical protein